MPVGAGSSPGGDDETSTPGSSDAKAMAAGWLKVNESKRTNEIITGITLDKYLRIGAFMALLLEKIPPYEIQYQAQPLDG